MRARMIRPNIPLPAISLVLPSTASVDIIEVDNVTVDGNNVNRVGDSGVGTLTIDKGSTAVETRLIFGDDAPHIDGQGIDFTAKHDSGDVILIEGSPATLARPYCSAPRSQAPRVSPPQAVSAAPASRAMCP